MGFTDEQVEVTISYGEVNDYGRVWCKKCQHGCYFNDEGYCITCYEKERITKLVNKDEVKVELEVVEEPVVKVTKKKTYRTKKKKEEKGSEKTAETLKDSGTPTTLNVKE